MTANVFSAGRSVAGKACPGWWCRCVAGWLLLVLAPWAAAQMPPARVIVAAVQRRDLSAGQTFVGTVVPLRISTVGSLVEGRVEELLVNEGDKVKGRDGVSEGDVLAKLRTTQLEFQSAAATAELRIRSNELAELTTVLPAQIEQARARTEAAEALMKFAGLRLRRSQSLFVRNSISEDELQEKESVAEAARQKYREDKAASEALQDSQHEKIAQAKARVDAQQAEVDRLQDQLKEHTIRAPFDGYVTKEHAQQGEWLAKGAPVVELVELKEVDVEAAVPEKYFSQVHVGMEARVTIAALPGQSWDDRVELIVPQADVRSRSFPVKVRLENPPERLLFKPGMFARVTLPVGSKQRVLLVAKDAVVLGGESPVVYVVDPISEAPGAGAPPSKRPPAEGPAPPAPSPDGVARLVPVELGALVDDLVEVRGPAIEVGKTLKPGDYVVVEGNERLSPGCPLIITNRDWPRSKRPAAKPSK